MLRSLGTSGTRMRGRPRLELLRLLLDGRIAWVPRLA